MPSRSGCQRNGARRLLAPGVPEPWSAGRPRLQPGRPDVRGGGSVGLDLVWVTVSSSMRGDGNGNGGLRERPRGSGSGARWMTGN